MVGIDPASDGLRRAQRLECRHADGVRGLIDMPEFDDMRVVFDANRPRASRQCEICLAPHRKKLRRPHPAGVGPFSSCRRVQPARKHSTARMCNMVTLRGAGPPIPVGSRRRRHHIGALRRDRRFVCLEVGGTGQPGQHRRVHRDHRPAPLRSSAAANGPKAHHSCSLRPNPPGPGSCGDPVALPNRRRTTSKPSKATWRQW